MQNERSRSGFDAELYRRIDEVVHYLWDPIGVSPHPQARDEYASYVPALYRGVCANDKGALVEYMRWVVTERMRLPFDRDGAESAAQVMLDWGEHLEVVEAE